MENKVYIYHVKNLIGEMVGTVALQKTADNKRWCRGITIIDDKCQFSRKFGRNKAIGLLNSAMQRNENSQPFGAHNENGKKAWMLHSYHYNQVYETQLHGQPKFRSQYDVTLTDYEQRHIVEKSEVQNVVSK